MSFLLIRFKSLYIIKIHFFSTLTLFLSFSEYFKIDFFSITSQKSVIFCLYLFFAETKFFLRVISQITKGILYLFSLYYYLQQTDIIDIDFIQNLGLKTTTCGQLSDESFDVSQQTLSKVRQVKKIEFNNPGGGGGGATAIFMVNIMPLVK